MTRRRKWLAAIGAALLVGFIALLIAGTLITRKIEPYVRQQAEDYLRTRFNADVKIASLHVQLPRLSPLRMLFTRGRGSIAWVEGGGVVIRKRAQEDLPALLTIGKFSGAVDVGALFVDRMTLPVVAIEGMEINIPPKGERRAHGSPRIPRGEGKNSLVIERVEMTDTVLFMLPRDTRKRPLRFAIHDLKLQSAGREVAMTYDAMLTNPSPPGEIHSVGTFGPWNEDEPGDTPLRGDYTFDHADLGVFRGIAGILHSTGRFEGELDSITARGEATVPDFRLKRSGNPVPLRTQFEVLVDGTSGYVTLKPVNAVLGSTRFTTSGAVFKNEGDTHRQILLDVNMPAGDMRDVLRLAMKGAPFMEGRLMLKTKLGVPPLSGRVKDKLLLDGRFEITGGKFLRSTMQDQIDGLSRRGQGQPKNQEIDEVVSRMTGKFKMDDAVIQFRELTYGVPGADIGLDGVYDLDADTLDFHGALGLQAKISQTMTGWKRWLLKPIDPFFAKNGAGTYLKIKVVGTSKAPKFGLDR